MERKKTIFTTKCQLGTLPEDEVYDKLNSSLTKSLDNMKLNKVNLFLLHSQLIEDNYKLFKFDESLETTDIFALLPGSLAADFISIIPS